MPERSWSDVGHWRSHSSFRKSIDQRRKLFDEYTLCSLSALWSSGKMFIMKQLKAILLGIVVAFVFSEYIGKFFAVLIGSWLNLGGELIDDLVGFATILGVILGIVVYKHYTKSIQKNEQV